MIKKVLGHLPIEFLRRIGGLTDAELAGFKTPSGDPATPSDPVKYVCVVVF